MCLFVTIFCSCIFGALNRGNISRLFGLRKGDKGPLMNHLLDTVMREKFDQREVTSTNENPLSQTDGGIYMKPPPFQLISSEAVQESSAPIQAMDPGREETSVLQPGRLNVIGEYHPESEVDIELEKEYVKEKGFDDYRTETWLSSLEGAGWFKKGKMVAGDPGELRFMHRLAFARKEIEKLRKGKNNCEKDGDYIGFFNLIDPLKSINKNLSQCKLEMELIGTRGHAPRKGLSDLRKKLEKSWDRFEKMYGTLEFTLDQFETMELARLAGAPSETMEVCKERAEKFLFAFEDYWDSANLPEVSEEEICHERSKFMLQAANAQSQKNWVWKIGDKHRREMEAMGKKMDFHLISKEAFRDEFESWKERQAGN